MGGYHVQDSKISHRAEGGMGGGGKANIQVQCKKVQFMCAILFDFFLVWHCVWMFKYLPILQILIACWKENLDMGCFCSK